MAEQEGVSSLVHEMESMVELGSTSESVMMVETKMDSLALVEDLVSSLNPMLVAVVNHSKWVELDDQTCIVC